MHERIWMRFPNPRSDNRKSKRDHADRKRPRRRKWLRIFTLVVAFGMAGAVAQAQQPAKVPRIGFQLDAPVSATAARIEGFRQGLRELGYVEGKNIIIEWRSSEGNIERRSEIAAELVRLKVDVIVSGGP